MNKSRSSFWNAPRRLLLNWLGIDQQRVGDDQEFFVGVNTAALRDRTLANYRDVIEISLERWRNDPLARRIVTITTQFVIGRGIRISAAGEAEDKLIREFWEHPLNHMDARVQEWSDELCRTGNLFLLMSSDPSGMSYVRAIPAGQIDEVISRDNDVEQEIAFKLREMPAPDRSVFPVQKIVPAADLLEPTLEERMLHFSINRPVGGQWGEPDLAPLLEWLRLYSEWLTERARLNKYRNCFLYVVKASRLTEAGRLRRQQQLNAVPPATGSILVMNEDEEWSVIAPQLESEEANEDGLTLKKMIAAGAGIPLQFLAEPGNSSKADSEALDGSTCRNFEQRQKFILWMVEEVLRQVLARAALVDHRLHPGVGISVVGDDIRPVMKTSEE